MASRNSQNPSELTEVALLYKAGAVVRALNGRLPSEQDLRHITDEHGPELATAVWIRAVQEHELHGPFSREVMSFSFARDLEPVKSRFPKYEVTVVASTLAGGGRAWGSHVEEWRSWARELGFTTEVIATLPGNTLEQNARLISEFLLAEPHPRRILVTYGQGTSEFRTALDRRLRPLGLGGAGAGRGLAALEGPLAGGVEFKGVAAWFSICGSFGGAASSSLAVANPMRRLAARLRLMAEGRPARIHAQTASEAWMWKGEAPVPNGALVASVVGAPVGTQLPYEIIGRYKALAKSGPNDGAVMLSEAVVNPSIVVPVPGLSHYCESVRLKPVFQRLLGVTVRTLEGVVAESNPRTDATI